jgi:hypothetical protein
MLDLDKLRKEPDVVAAYVALMRIFRDSFDTADTAEQVSQKLRNALVMIGFAIGRLDKELEKQGCSEQYINDVMAKVHT